MSNRNSTTNKVLRDFIYVNLERLYSVYSQVFEGVVDTIVRAVIGEEKRQQEKSIDAENQIAQELATASFHRENAILYDHMYNVLETKLGASIIVPEALEQHNYGSISDKPIIKVTGHARMEDYTNLSQFTDKWNDFAEAIAAGHILQMQEEIDAVRQNLNMIKDRNEKARKNKLLDVQTKYLSRISC